MDVALVAVHALVGPFPGMQALVKLQVHELGELGRADLALVGLLARVQAQVGLKIAGAAEAFVANLRGGDGR